MPVNKREYSVTFQCQVAAIGTESRLEALWVRGIVVGEVDSRPIGDTALPIADEDFAEAAGSFGNDVAGGAAEGDGASVGRDMEQFGAAVAARCARGVDADERSGA